MELTYCLVQKENILNFFIQSYGQFHSKFQCGVILIVLYGYDCLSAYAYLVRQIFLAQSSVFT